jgi:predicted Fe-Mo cluster-binding NifX family protein
LKIAFPTDDGRTISAHFGRAQSFVVATVEGDGEPQLEQRSKDFHGGEGEHEAHDHHGHDHGGMLSPLAGCQVLIAGGMGDGAQQAALAQGLEVILTGEKQITAALAAYRAGTLTSDPRRLHRHNRSTGGTVKLEL